MIVRAPRPEANFVMVRNAVARDERLSFRARGVLVAILSRPDDWSISAENLAREGSESVGVIYKTLKELEEAGYVKRRRVRNELGQVRTETLVFDEPTSEKPSDGEPKNGKTDSRFLASDTKTELQKQNTNTEHKVSRSPNSEQARGISQAWWEKQDRPTGKFIALQKIVERTLDAGWEPQVVSQALGTFVVIPSLAQLELQMKGRRGTQTKYDRNRQVLEQTLRQQQKNDAIRLAFDALDKGNNEHD
jgi:DNA-binding transcriptional ArsR family regulator